LLRIPESELLSRRTRVCQIASQREAAAYVSFSATSIFYLTGFAFIPTERPIALFLKESGESTLFVPRLEVEHAEEVAYVDEIASYPEFPGVQHPLRRLAESMSEAGLGSERLLAESDGYGSSWGYEGPRLSEVLTQAEVMVDRRLIEEMRFIKSPAEIRLIRESCKWGNLAHRLLQDYSRSGLTETEVSMRASQEATMSMIRTLGPEYRPMGRSGASAGFRGQIGANSALPHAVTINAVLKPGDTLVTGASSTVWGYVSELERTMFLGPPNPDQVKYFGYMLEAQDAAFRAVKPGRPCSEVDEAVLEVYRKYDAMDCWRHHTGHALGLLGHEAPFFDRGDGRIMEPGMVFSIEPGFYVPGLGGFRHSDTVLVTEEGMEMLTYYPRELEDMIIPL